MKKIICLFLISFFVYNISAANEKKISVQKELFNNINLGWDVKRTSDYRWRNFHIGTAYGEKFDFNPKYSWQVGMNFNWNRYTLYNNGDVALSSHNSILRNQSISFPIIMNYQLYKTFFTGLNLYSGPVVEIVFPSTLDRVDFENYNPLQMGWTIGTKLKFLAIFSAKLAYNYYPTSLLTDKIFNRSAVSFSIGF